MYRPERLFQTLTIQTADPEIEYGVLATEPPMRTAEDRAELIEFAALASPTLGSEDFQLVDVEASAHEPAHTRLVYPTEKLPAASGPGAVYLAMIALTQSVAHLWTGAHKTDCRIVDPSAVAIIRDDVTTSVLSKNHRGRQELINYN